ncbi:MAG: response regulator [Gammaproteobacteria bacterium]|nr:response regulator [Gammaproteobacteria bacterium]MDH5628882.1 response regulator [Gammaproteobacteria bacterium]
MIPVIIIDDDEPYRNVLARSLKRQGFQAEAFAAPLPAMAEIASHKNPVVLLDLRLDNDSGLLWIEKIRQQNASARIVLLTGYASISTAVEAIKLGAEDYLPKPITASEIAKYLTHGKDEQLLDPQQPMSVERLEWEHIQKVLKEHDGNISASARAMGMHRRTLQRKLAKKPVQK